MVASLWAAPEDPDSTFSPFGALGLTLVANNVSQTQTGIAIDSLGRIVVVGTVSVGAHTDAFIARFLSNGQLDNSFGVSGVRTVNSFGGTRNDTAVAVAIDTSNRIVFVGTTDFTTDKDIWICRLTTTGLLDSSFNGDGEVFFNADGGTKNDEATCVAIDSAGRILVGGFSFNPNLTASGTNDLTILRLTNAGDLDSNFNTTGVAHFHLGTNDRVTGLAFHSGGRIFASFVRDNACGVIRLNAGGDINVAWASSGIRNLPLPGTTQVITGIKVDANDQAVVCGHQVLSSGTKIFVAKIAFNGNSDDWIVQEDYGASVERGMALAIQRDGDIVIAGFSSSGPGLAVLRYTPNGRRDPGFNRGFGGFAANVTGLPNEIGLGVAIQKDGKIVLGGRANGYFFAYRIVGELSEYYYGQADLIYAYFSGLGQSREALSYWFYYRAFGDQIKRVDEANQSLASKEFYQGLAYFYYTFLEGQPGRLYFYYLYLGYSEYTSRQASGDSAGATAYYNYYVNLANSFL